MDDINDEKYTYDAGIPWPDSAEQRITALEREQATQAIQLAHLARLVHRLLNAGEVAEDDGK